MTDFAFLHGGGQGGWVWKQTIAALHAQAGDTVRTLALDVPGCGAKRGRDTSTIAFDAIVAELIADIEAAGLRDVVLVGHSQAGGVLPRMAEARPDLFARLIYASCSSPLPGQTVLEMMGKGLHGETPDEIGWYETPDMGQPHFYKTIFANDMTDAQSDALLADMAGDMWPMSSYAETDWRYGLLARIPSRYIVFLRDRALPPEWQERLADRFHAGSVVRIDSGHQGMITRPHAVAEALLLETEGQRHGS